MNYSHPLIFDIQRAQVLLLLELLRLLWLLKWLGETSGGPSLPSQPTCRPAPGPGSLRHSGSPHVFPETPSTPYHSPSAGASPDITGEERRGLLSLLPITATHNSSMEKTSSSLWKAPLWETTWECGEKANGHRGWPPQGLLGGVDECRRVQQAFNSGRFYWAEMLWSRH